MTGSSSTALAPAASRALAEIAAAVAALPALPPAAAGDRYGARPVTAAWLAAAAPDTRRAYYADLARWLAWCTAAGVDPLAARRADADVFAAQLAGAARTVARRLAAVSSWYAYLAESTDRAAGNPFAAVRRPKTAGEPSPTVGLSADDAAALLDAADARLAAVGATEAALRDALVLRLLVDTGLRVGALLGADLTDLGAEDGHRVLWYRNKGGRRLRTALPQPHATGLLDRYLAARAARAGVDVAGLAGPLLVTRPYRGRPGGRRLVQRDVWQLLRSTATAAGLAAADRLSPHSLRRTFNTVAKQAGVPLEDRQDALGHGDPRTTQGYDDDRHNLDRSPTIAVAAALARRQRGPRARRGTPTSDRSDVPAMPADRGGVPS